MYATSAQILPFNRRDVVCSLLGISKSTLYRRIRDGGLPPLETLGGHGKTIGYYGTTLRRIVGEP